MKTYLIIGASRGIGLEFVQQILARPNTYVYAAARNPETASLLDTATYRFKDRCMILKCDVSNERSCELMVDELVRVAAQSPTGKLQLDYCIFNAGVLIPQSRAINATFTTLSQHLTTNTIGPLTLASLLLSHHPNALSLHNLTFISSDSGAHGNFLAYEDGFAAYAMSKCALNMGIRHMAAEMRRQERYASVSVFAVHPGEVATDMGDVEVDWEVKGVIEVDESVRGCLKVIEERRVEESGTFWTWEGKDYPW